MFIFLKETKIFGVLTIVGIILLFSRIYNDSHTQKTTCVQNKVYKLKLLQVSKILKETYVYVNLHCVYVSFGLGVKRIFLGLDIVTILLVLN